MNGFLLHEELAHHKQLKNNEGTIVNHLPIYFDLIENGILIKLHL